MKRILALSIIAFTSMVFANESITTINAAKKNGIGFSMYPSSTPGIDYKKQGYLYSGQLKDGAALPRITNKNELKKALMNKKIILINTVDSTPVILPEYFRVLAQQNNVEPEELYVYLKENANPILRKELEYREERSKDIIENVAQEIVAQAVSAGSGTGSPEEYEAMYEQAYGQGGYLTIGQLSDYLTPDEMALVTSGAVTWKFVSANGDDIYILPPDQTTFDIDTVSAHPDSLSEELDKITASTVTTIGNEYYVEIILNNDNINGMIGLILDVDPNDPETINDFDETVTPASIMERAILNAYRSGFVYGFSQGYILGFEAGWIAAEKYYGIR